MRREYFTRNLPLSADFNHLQRFPPVGRSSRDQPVRREIKRRRGQCAFPGNLDALKRLKISLIAVKYAVAETFIILHPGGRQLGFYAV